MFKNRAKNFFEVGDSAAPSSWSWGTVAFSLSGDQCLQFAAVLSTPPCFTPAHPTHHVCKPRPTQQIHKLLFQQREKTNGVREMTRKHLNSNPWLCHPSSRSTRWGVKHHEKLYLWQFSSGGAEALLSRVRECADICEPWQLWWAGQERGSPWWGRFSFCLLLEMSYPAGALTHLHLRIWPAC